VVFVLSGAWQLGDKLLTADQGASWEEGTHTLRLLEAQGTLLFSEITGCQVIEHNDLKLAGQDRFTENFVAIVVKSGGRAQQGCRVVDRRQRPARASC
jgi:hypothetical protein